MKIVKRCIKYAIYAIALAALIVLIIGSFNVNAPKELTKIIWNSALTQAYTDDPDSFRVWYPQEFEDNYSTDDGKFYFCNVRYIPDALQWQVTVGCNDSTVRDFAEDRGISLSSDEENFRFVLKDSEGNIYSEYDYLYVHKSRHGFRRLIFTGVPKNGISKLTLCIYYTGDVKDTLPGKELAALDIYDAEIKMQEWDGEDVTPSAVPELIHRNPINEVTEQ